MGCKPKGAFLGKEFKFHCLIPGRIRESVISQDLLGMSELAPGSPFAIILLFAGRTGEAGLAEAGGPALGGAAGTIPD